MNSVVQLDAEVKTAREIRRWLENERASDPQFDDLLLDTIEGETRLNELLAALAREATLREAMAEGCKKHIETTRARANRLVEGAEKFRAKIAWAMDAAGIRKVAVDDVTISYRRGSPKPVVFDADQLPERFTKAVTTIKPDMNAIGDFIDESGQLPSGVQMTNGADVVTIRRG